MSEGPVNNKFQETSNSKGFFKVYFNEFRASITDEQMKTFASIRDDEGRVVFVSKILPDCKEVYSETNNGKNSAEAKQLKDKGNAEFVRGDTKKALESYNRAILLTPFDANSNSDIAVALANRSAALYHLEQFEEALQDIDLALSYEYPKELRYKILERKAKCFLGLKRHPEALVAFRKTLQSLDDCKLAMEKKLKMQKDIQLMLNLLSKPTTQQGHVNAFVEGDKLPRREITIPSVTGKRNVNYPALSDFVCIKEEESFGRYAAASTLIQPGDIVAVEKAYCCVLLAEHASSHCLNCVKWVSSPYPCSGCSVAVFCSSVCHEAAKSSFHGHECSIMHALYRSGASVMVLMALRIVSQQNLQFFVDTKPSLQEPWQVLKKHRSNDYLSVYHLVRHEDQRPAEDFFERTVMAVFLLRSLQKVGYFGSKCDNIEGCALTPEESFIGGLILRHLQLLQFNAHEVAELETDCTESIDRAKSIFIGGGLFSTLALFNHSCDPGVVRYFIGTTVIVRTIRPIVQGEMLAENYGPIFTVKDRAARKNELRAQYLFDCSCQACEDDWPLLKNMDRSIIRFRCDGGDDMQCAGVLLVPHNTDQFMPKCSSCGRHTNLLKGLKILQDTDAMFRQASLDKDRGRLQSALDIYLEILRLLNRHLAPPFYDYHLCQEAIRKCMLGLGNKYNKDV